MKCYTFSAGKLFFGVLCRNRVLVLGARGKNSWERRVELSRQYPAEVVKNIVKFAELEFICPMASDGFYVLKDSGEQGHLIHLVCRSWERLRGKGDDVQGWTPELNHALIELPAPGALRVETESGETVFLVREQESGPPLVLELTEFELLEQRWRETEAEAERERLEQERMRLEAQRLERELHEAEERRWIKKEVEFTLTVTGFSYRRHSGVSLCQGHYRPTDTYVVVTIPGDTKSARTISVDDAIRERTGWKLITQRRKEALRKTLPKAFTLSGKRTWEEHDTGKRRREDLWYEIHPADLNAWIDRAVAALP